MNTLASLPNNSEPYHSNSLIISYDSHMVDRQPSKQSTLIKIVQSNCQSINITSQCLAIALLYIKHHPLYQTVFEFRYTYSFIFINQVVKKKIHSYFGLSLQRISIQEDVFCKFLFSFQITKKKLVFKGKMINIMYVF